jgi:uncharacterized protein (TIGR03067 family)
VNTAFPRNRERRFRYKTTLFTAVFVLFTGLACCAEALDNPLVGRWLVQRVGTRDATKFPFKIEWEFTKDQLIVRDVTNSQEISRNSYTLDLTKDPKWFTVTVVDRAAEVRPGIFRVVGDELHIRQSVGGGARPTEFVKDGYSIMKKLAQGNGQQDGATNGSQPIRSETNRISSATGSRR